MICSGISDGDANGQEMPMVHVQPLLTQKDRVEDQETRLQSPPGGTPGLISIYRVQKEPDPHLLPPETQPWMSEAGT